LDICHQDPRVFCEGSCHISYEEETEIKFSDDESENLLPVCYAPKTYDKVKLSQTIKPNYDHKDNIDKEENINLDDQYDSDNDKKLPALQKKMTATQLINPIASPDKNITTGRGIDENSAEYWKNKFLETQAVKTTTPTTIGSATAKKSYSGDKSQKKTNI
jgi:hypothetical protein